MENTFFVDGIGRRMRMVDATGEEVETLRLCRELSDAPTTEPALVDRAGRLAAFNHRSFAQVRRVERLRGVTGGLAVVSAAVSGARLAEVLKRAERNLTPPDPHAALFILHEVSSALAALHKLSRDFAHGTVGPERIVLRPDGHVVLGEYILGPAIEQMQMGRAPLWTQFRVPVPAVAGSTRLDQMTDVLQVGMLALALMLGRPILRDEFPQRLQDLLAVAAPDALARRSTLVRSIRGWLLRTLQFETRSAFRTMADAAAALEGIIAEEAIHLVTPAAVVKYLAACSSEPDAARAATPAAERIPQALDRVSTVELAPSVAAPTPQTKTAIVAERVPSIHRAPVAERTAAEPAPPLVRKRVAEPAALVERPRASASDTRRVGRASADVSTTTRVARRPVLSPRPFEPSGSPLEPAADTLVAPRPLSFSPGADPLADAPLVEPLAAPIAMPPSAGSVPPAGPALSASLACRAARVLVGATRSSLAHLARFDSTAAGRGVRVGIVSLGLAALYGATYLGARGYLTLPSLVTGKGTLVVESRPAGAELYVDGFPSGQTPATLELRAGEHTLALSTGKNTTLVPVVVVSGARRVERVEIRSRRPAPASRNSTSSQLPPSRLPK